MEDNHNQAKRPWQKPQRSSFPTGVYIGKVTRGFPEIQIKLITTDSGISERSNESIVNRDQLLFADYLLVGYIREYEALGNTTYETFETDLEINSSDMSLAGQGPHIHNILEIAGEGTAEGEHFEEGQINYTNFGISEGDLVAITKVVGTNYYYVHSRIEKYIPVE